MGIQVINSNDSSRGFWPIFSGIFRALHGTFESKDKSWLALSAVFVGIGKGFVQYIVTITIKKSIKTGQLHFEPIGFSVANVFSPDSSLP